MPTPDRSRWGIASRLFGAMLLVLIVAAITAWLMASWIGPGIFHDHLTQSGAGKEAQSHAEMAFRSASATALTWALLASLVTAALITWFVASRMSQALATVAKAAELVVDGNHRLTVPHGGLGHEFDHMIDAFNEMAAELDGMEQTRTRILADLAHEMRTPLATLDAYLEAVADGVQELDPDTIVLLREQTLRLTRLARDVSLVTAAEEGRLEMHPSEVDLGDLLRSATAQANARYQAGERRLILDLALLPDGTFLHLDRDRIGQVMTNLLDNAFRHTSPGGTVLVDALADDGSVTIRVRDDGNGIEPEHLPRVFDRFYRVDAARDRGHGGSGVGLAIAKAIVTEHGGSITADSPGSGLGTTISLQLPWAATEQT